MSTNNIIYIPIQVLVHARMSAHTAFIFIYLHMSLVMLNWYLPIAYKQENIKYNPREMCAIFLEDRGIEQRFVNGCSAGWWYRHGGSFILLNICAFSGQRGIQASIKNHLKNLNENKSNYEKATNKILAAHRVNLHIQMLIKIYILYKCVCVSMCTCEYSCAPNAIVFQFRKVNSVYS